VRWVRDLRAPLGRGVARGGDLLLLRRSLAPPRSRERSSRSLLRYDAAMEHRDPLGPVFGPYRAAADVSPREALRSRSTRLRLPIGRALFAPSYVGAALVGVPAIAIVSLNGVAHEAGLYLAPRTVRLEDGIALCLLGTLPLLAYALVRNVRRFPAPRASKRRYVTRRLAAQTVLLALAILLAIGVRPVGTTILASASRFDGRAAYVHRFEWGCGYRLGVTEGRWMEKAFRPLAGVLHAARGGVPGA
jgi:hypothetical protein